MALQALALDEIKLMEKGHKAGGGISVCPSIVLDHS
jgi:hypothetical protein